MQNFSISAVWNQAWKAFKRNWLTGVGLVLLPGLISLIQMALIAAVKASVGLVISRNLILLILISTTLKTLFLEAVYVQWGLRASQSEAPISFGQAFPSSIGAYMKVIIGLIIIDLVPWIIFAVGYFMLLGQNSTMTYGSETGFSATTFLVFLFGAIILLVFPILFFTYPYWIVDRDEGIFPSLQKSFALSSQNLGKIIGFLLSALGINLLGALPCFLGLYITRPMTWAAGAALYRALTENRESGSTQLA